jgi:hypothetical protein
MSSQLAVLPGKMTTQSVEDDLLRENDHVDHLKID